MSRVRFLPDAASELRAAAIYYETHVPGLGKEFLSEVERQRSVLAEIPKVGGRYGRDHRRILLRRFPYSLIYRVDGRDITIVAVAHSKRRPGYWETR